MLHRFLAILLMLFTPIQGFAVPHSHGPMDGTQPDDHDHRPHFHLCGHHHHHGHSHCDGHSHDSCPSDDQREAQTPGTPEAPTEPSNHEDDALYVSGDLGLNLTNAAPTVADTGLEVWTDPVSPADVGTPSSINAVPHFLARGDTPIYLTTLSLRL